MSAEYQYQFTMQISGLLYDEQIKSPGHSISLRELDAHIKIKLLMIKPPAYLDCDLVINFNLEQTEIGNGEIFTQQAAIISIIDDTQSIVSRMVVHKHS